MHTPKSEVTRTNQSRRSRSFIGRSITAVGSLLLVLIIAADPRAQPEADAPSVRLAALQEGISELDPRVAYLKARQDVWDTSKRYTRGADRHDKELVRSAFWPEAMISYGTAMARDEFVDWQESYFADFAAHQHHVTGQTVDFDGDTAHVETYVLYFLVPRDRSIDEVGEATPGLGLESERTYLGSGRYIERWERRNSEWKILVREHIEDLALEGATVDLCGGNGCLGTWDSNDPSYLRPLETLTAEQRQARSQASRNTRHPLGAAGVAGSEP